jgi:membrane protein implicated in regulation of membrane protease activity
MTKPNPTELNMTLEGEFVSPPTAPISSRILMWAIIVAVMAGAIALAAFALWIALLILPVAIGAAVLAWGAYRYRMWREQASLGRQRSVRRR